MNTNQQYNKQIESLNRELKILLAEIQEEPNPDKVAEMWGHAEELKENIAQLSLNCEIDHDSIIKAMAAKAACNALIHHILNNEDIKEMIEELYSCGLTRHDLTANKEAFINAMRNNGCEVEKYSKYYDYLKLKVSHANSYSKRSEFNKDSKWIQGQDIILNLLVESLNIDEKTLEKMFNKMGDQPLDNLIERYEGFNKV